MPDRPTGECCLAGRLAAIAAAHPERPALRTTSGWLTFRGVVLEVMVRARRLTSSGTEPGDEIGLAFDDQAEMALWCLTAWWVGAAAVPLDARNPPDQVKRVARARGVGVLVTRLAQLDGPEEPGALGVGDCRPSAGGGNTAEGSLSSHVCGAAGDRDSVALVCHSSGSTGRPHAVAHNRSHLIGQLAAATDTPLVWCSPLSLATIAGYAAFAQSLLCGHALVPASLRHPRVFAELLVAERVAIVAMTPSMLELLVRVPSIAALDWGNLQVIGVGGAPTPVRLATEARTVFGAAVVASYGSAELGGPVALAVLDGESVDGEIGLPLSGWELLVASGREGEPAEAGIVGELMCRRTTGTSRWVRTGDLARRLDSGRFQVLGRQDAMTSRGGRSVHPATAERVLCDHPGVWEATVVGVPSGRAGHDTLVAFFTRGASVMPDARVLRAHCAAHLPPHEVPDWFEACDALRQTPDGKVHVASLRAQATMLVARRRSELRGSRETADR